MKAYPAPGAGQVHRKLTMMGHASALIDPETQARKKHPLASQAAAVNTTLMICTILIKHMTLYVLK